MVCGRVHIALLHVHHFRLSIWDLPRALGMFEAISPGSLSFLSAQALGGVSLISGGDSRITRIYDECTTVWLKSALVYGMVGTSRTNIMFANDAWQWC